MVGLDLLIVLGVIALILILQPLILLAWVYLVYRASVNYTARRAEKAVDGRIDRAAEQLNEAVGGSGE